MESPSSFDAPTNAAVFITANVSPTSQISSGVIIATTGSSLSAPPVTYSPTLPVIPSTVAPSGASSSLPVEIPVTSSMAAPSGASSSSLPVEGKRREYMREYRQKENAKLLNCVTGKGWMASKIPRHGVDINDIINDANDEDHIDEDQDEAEEGSNRGRARKTVTMREYYAYKFQMRPTENVLLLGGGLLQQYAVDVYIKIETARLKFCEHRVDLYQGLVDCVNVGEVDTSRVGQRVVLPASFIGGPRDMSRRFLDAMTLVQDDGKPHIFLTVTCNPGWDEILEDLEPGQTAQDRPDVVSRVFHAKLEDLKKQLLEKHVLGEVRAYVYVIEYQKRGLPHAHWLLIMKPTANK